MVGVARTGRDARLAGLLQEAKEYLARRQPELVAEERAGFISVTGKFVVRDDGGPLDSFEINMAVPRDFPVEELIVWEVGSRIPRTVDMHVFEKDGTLCLGVWEAWLARTPNASFAAYLEGPVADYFFGQSLVAIGEPWPFGEREHGLPGILGAYAEVLGVDADKEVVTARLRLLTMRSLKGHHRCFCGSGRRLRDCHMAELSSLSKQISSFLAARMLFRIS